MRPARSTGGRLIIAGYSVAGYSDAGYCVAANASSGTPYPTTPHSATPHPATPHPVHTRELGHHWFMTQISHLGRRAMHTRRPWRISVCENQVHWSRRTNPIRSRSIFTGSVSRVRPSRVDRRCTCVSTTIPSFFRNQVPSTTFAVLRPTPGSRTRASMVSGTSPPWRSSSAWAIPMMDLVLLRKNPVLWISCSSTAGSALAKSRAERYFANRAGVTMLTRASVDWADRMVATSSSSALSWRSAHVAPGYACSRRATILRTRRRRAASVSRPTRRRGLALVLAGMMVPGTYRMPSHDGSVASGLRRPGSGAREEGVEHAHEILRRLDVRGVPRGELDHAGGEERRRLTGRFQGHGVVNAVHQQGAGSGAVGEGLLEPRAEIVGSEALPHRLLDRKST